MVLNICNINTMHKTESKANETRLDPWEGISLQERDGWKVISHHPLPSEIQTFDGNPLGDTFNMNQSGNVFIFRQPDKMNCAFYSFMSLMVTLYKSNFAGNIPADFIQSILELKRVLCDIVNIDGINATNFTEITNKVFHGKNVLEIVTVENLMENIDKPFITLLLSNDSMLDHWVGCLPNPSKEGYSLVLEPYSGTIFDVDKDSIIRSLSENKLISKTPNPLNMKATIVVNMDIFMDLFKHLGSKSKKKKSRKKKTKKKKSKKKKSRKKKSKKKSRKTRKSKGKK